MYAPQHAQRMAEANQMQMGQQLSNYLGALGANPALLGIVQNYPELGLQLFQASQKQEDLPSDVRSFNYYNKLPQDQRPAFEKYLQLTHPGMSTPVVLGPYDRIEGNGGAQQGSEVTATGPNGEKIRYNPQSGQWEPMGGPASPTPGGFPR